LGVIGPVFLAFSWIGFLLSLAPVIGRRGEAADGRRQRRAGGYPARGGLIVADS